MRNFVYCNFSWYKLNFRFLKVLWGMKCAGEENNSLTFLLHVLFRSHGHMVVAKFYLRKKKKKYRELIFLILSPSYWRSIINLRCYRIVREGVFILFFLNQYFYIVTKVILLFLLDNDSFYYKTPFDLNVFLCFHIANN